MANDKKTKEEVNNTSILISVYQAANQEIEFCKNQQWKILYYSIVVYGSIFGVFTQTKSNEWLLVGIGLIVFLIASILSCRLNNAINNSRGILGEIQASIPLIYKISNPERKSCKIDTYVSDLEKTLKEDPSINYCKNIRDKVFDMDNKILRKYGYFVFLSVFNFVGYIIMIHAICNYLKTTCSTWC